MSSPVSVVPPSRAADTAADRPGRLALVVLVACLVLGAALRATFLVWHPPFDTDFFDYDSMAPIRDAWFVMHLFVGVPGWLLVFPAFGMLAVLASPAGVGRVLAVLGGLVASIGAILFATGLAGEGAAWAWATDPAVVDPEAGAQLLRGIETVPFTTTIILVGNALIPLGLAAVLVGLLVSAAVPRWLALATLLVLALSALLPPLPILSAILVVAQSVGLVAIGWFGLSPRRR